nr:hypothetical protein [uncultured archaeon]AQS29422.1 hypothetical protein [uncultured archaeon]
MSIDKIIEAARIEFPRPLELKEINELFDYISANLPANISTTTEYYMNRYLSEENKIKKRGGH